MTELLTAAQMRTIEQAAINSGEVTGLELMERAGIGVVEAILEEWPEMALTSQKAVVLCGPGNNGGDGFVVARILKQRGWDVEVFLYGEVGKLPPDAKANAERWLEMGEVGPLENSSFDTRVETEPFADILIDAILGSGLSRGFFELGNIQDDLNYFRCSWATYPNLPKVVSIDVPSGLSSDNGTYPGFEKENPLDSCILANLTVTFHRPYVGHFLSVGSASCGKLCVKSIGLKQSIKINEIKTSVSLVPSVEAGFFPAMYRVRDKHSLAHKYAHGHALILSGPSARTGAARLAARGALRIGAGLVTIGAGSAAMPEHAAQLTSIMLSEVPDADALREKLQDKRINALCLGPGLGLDERALGLVDVAVRGDHAPYGVVLDADALTILAQEPDLFAALHENTVLTPHAGEFKRMFPDIAAKLDKPPTCGPAYSKVDATRDAAKRAGCVVLYKGADTVIADQTGRAAINSAHYDRAAPWLATAGSGDVLAGFITGLLARGFAPMHAAETAAWLHVECALKFGPGLIAEDLPEQLPKVFRSLNL